LRYLIKTKLALGELSAALDPDTLIEEAGPPVRLADGDFLDLDITQRSLSGSDVNLSERLQGIDGIDKVIVVPDAEPG